MSETPARRTRASTRASATPAPSGVGSRRRGKTPKALPAVPTATSHAYGSTGVVSLATQLADSATDTGGFAARFGADRGAAISRDVVEGPSGAVPGPSSKAGKSVKPPPVLSKAPVKPPPVLPKVPVAPAKTKPSPATKTPAAAKIPPSTGTAVPTHSAAHLSAAEYLAHLDAVHDAATHHSSPEYLGHHLVTHHDEVEDEDEDSIVDYIIEDDEDEEQSEEDEQFDQEQQRQQHQQLEQQQQRQQQQQLERQQKSEQQQRFEQQRQFEQHKHYDQGGRDDLVPTREPSSFREPSAAEGSVTDLDTVFSYGGPKPPSSSIRRRVASLQPPATSEETRAAEPWSLSVFLETIHRRYQEFGPSWQALSSFIQYVIFALLAVLLLRLISGPGTWSGIYEKGANGLHRTGEYLKAPFSHLPTPSRDGHVVGNGDVSKRLHALEAEMRNLRNEVGDIDVAELKRLQESLPEHVVVRKNAKTGQFEIPTNFWHALRAKLDHRDSGNTWESFIRANGKKLDDLSNDAVHKSLNNQHIITKDMLIEAVEEKHTEFKKLYAKELLRLEESVRNSAESVARNTVTDVMKALPMQKGNTQLQSLALANIARNTEIAIRQVNYFSFNYGAYIDIPYTSPTHERQQSGWFSRHVFDITRHGHPSPNWAINAWSEASECWCAASSEKFGKAQLGVRMPRSIKPTSITIEHIPSSGTLDIAAAPKEFEVWVQNLSGKGKVPENINSHLGCGAAPSKGFVCVGKGRYDIYALNHVQNFELEEADDAVGFVNQAVVKVLNNWGQDYTCLYRVRMHGYAEIAEGDRLAVD